MYRIKNFGNFTSEEQMRVIHAFKTNTQDIFFQYSITNYVNLSQHNLQNKYDYFEEYCADVLYFYNKKLKSNIETEIKQMLYFEIFNKDSILDKKKYEVIEELYIRIINGDTDVISKDILDKLVSLIYKELLINNIDKERENFAFKRMAFYNNLFIDERGVHKNDMNSTVWYQPQNEREYSQAMKSDFFYSCIIIDKGTRPEDYLYGFTYIETGDNYDLIIFVRDEVRFQQIIKTNIRTNTPEILNFLEKN